MAIPLSSCSTVAAVTLVGFLLLANTVPTTEGASILFFMGLGGASHRIAMMPLAKALVEDGHNVTFFAQEKPDEKDSKINYYVAKKLAEHFEEMHSSGDVFNFYDMRAKGMIKFIWFMLPSFGTTVCEKLYEDPDAMDWLKSNKFDLVIVDALFNECAYGVAHVHNAKLIIFSVSSVLPWPLEPLGIPDESSSVPDMIFHVPIQMNFFQRMLTAVMPIFWNAYREYLYLPKLQRITKEGLGLDDFPSFSELERNVSLTFMNTHVAQELPRSLPPNVVPIGGISWVEKRKPLPKNIEDFINRGKEGFVYVSFGSFIDFTMFPADVQQRFINALSRFPNIQFIWKLSKTPENLPANFFVDKWFPQQDILLHPKIRAFVTHSGICGVNGAIFSSVPLICFPIFAEQDYNPQLVEQKGFGIKMEIIELTEDGMANALSTILGDKMYSENMKKISKLFQDRPLTPLQTGLWWTKFVLRQESTDYLRPSSMHQMWWKRRQLDIWLFLLILLISINSLTIYVSYKLIKRCCGGGSKAKVSSSNKNGKKKLN